MQIPLTTTLILSFTLMAGCTWVELNDKGRSVIIVTAEQLSPACERIGVINASTRDSIVAGTHRNTHKVQQELNTLARNEAGQMKSNTIVAQAPATEGKQSFIAYRCP